MTPLEYGYLQTFLKQKSGLVLSDDKQYLIESRLMPIARKAGLQSISDLIAKLKTPSERGLQNDVVEAMTTNESFFFRDKTPFEHFVETIIPHMVENRPNKKVRIWCAAASTGQEPYSLAMCLKENAAKLNGARFEIVGTDLSTEVLEKAKVGYYSQFEVQRGLPVQYLLKYFKQNGEMWQVTPDIRSMVTYKPYNLLDSFTQLGQFDVIFCRNVLIYFDQATKSDILARLSKQMPDDGFLVLGAAETVVGLTNDFKSVPAKRGLYTTSRVAAASSVPLRAAVGSDVTPTNATARTPARPLSRPAGTSGATGAPGLSRPAGAAGLSRPATGVGAGATGTAGGLNRPRPAGAAGLASGGLRAGAKPALGGSNATTGSRLGAGKASVASSTRPATGLPGSRSSLSTSKPTTGTATRPSSLSRLSSLNKDK